MLIDRPYYAGIAKCDGFECIAGGAEGDFFGDSPEDVLHEMKVWDIDPSEYEIVLVKLVRLDDKKTHNLYNHQHPI